MLLRNVSSPKIQLWTPGIFDFKGGIQTYSGFLLRALQQQCPQANIQVFSTHDRAVAPRENTRFYGLGAVPPKIRIPAYGAQVVGAGLWERPDLIITTHANFAPAARYLKQIAGIPYWVVAHGFEVWDLQRPSVIKGLTAADRILPVSHYTQQRLITEQSIAPDQFSWLPNTFDVSRFNLAPKPIHLLTKHGLQSDQPIILTVNRLAAGESFHAYDQILRALPQLRQQLPQLHYLIVGKGNDRPRVEQLIQQLELNDCVTLVGFVSDAELPDYYNLCDVFAMPSKLEGFGIVFLEAMACGKPVLGGNQDGSIDALDGGRLGALVNPEQITEIAQTLQQLIQGTYPNPLLYQPDQLRQAVIDTYGLPAFQQRLQALLQQSPINFERGTSLARMTAYKKQPVKIYAE